MIPGLEVGLENGHGCLEHPPPQDLQMWLILELTLIRLCRNPLGFRELRWPMNELIGVKLPLWTNVALKSWAFCNSGHRQQTTIVLKNPVIPSSAETTNMSVLHYGCCSVLWHYFEMLGAEWANCQILKCLMHESKDAEILIYHNL